MKITNYAEAFDIINVNMSDRIKDIIKNLEKEGYTEKSICFAIWKSQEKIMSFRWDPRFISVLVNEIHKYAYKKNDPRWQTVKSR